MKTCPYKYMGCTLIGIDSIFSAVHVLVITCMVIQQRSEDEEHVQTLTYKC